MAQVQASAPTSSAPPVPTVTVVVNNREGLEIVQMPHAGKDTAGVTMTGEVVSLLPGANFVPTEKLAVLLKNPAFAAKFKNKIPRGVAPEHNPENIGKPVLEKGPELPAASPLLKLSDEEAATLIAEVLTADPLRGWLKEETRPQVRKALYAQIELLQGGEAKGGPAAQNG